MKFVADLHLHSKYSRAVSQDMILPKMAHWAEIKGINVLATGDFTHPFWFDQLKNKLEEVGNGLYRLKSEAEVTSAHPRGGDSQEVYFLLGSEISSIYSQGGKGRRIHNLVFFPSLASVSKFNESLLKRKANLRSDGRPIVGLSSRELVNLALEANEKALIIPAHIWTPWFSLYGSFSGFDSIKECFGDMAKYIYGIETGLSSDPAMNWQVEDLDNRAILSFSDAHSLEKMGREATVFEADEISYNSIYQAIVGVGPVRTFPPASASSKLKSISDQKDHVELRAVRIPSHSSLSLRVHPSESKTSPATHKNLPNNLTIQQSNNPKIAYTIEFYPEEGKYHFTGHRDCNFSQSPQETKAKGDTCPVCKRRLTVGVIHRVEELKTRDAKHGTRDIRGIKWTYHGASNRPPYVNLVPLMEIIAEAEGTSVKTKKVLDIYIALINSIGSELNVLMSASRDELKRYVSSKIVDGIERVRSGSINIDPGYDGKFGEVKIFTGNSDVAYEKEESQLNLFAS